MIHEHLDDGCAQAHDKKICLVELSGGDTFFVVKELMGYPMHC